MATIEISPERRSELTQLWDEYWRAFRLFIRTSQLFDAGREATDREMVRASQSGYWTGDALADLDAELADERRPIEEVARAAASALEAAKAKLLNGFAEAFGINGQTLAVDLTTALDRCYGPGSITMYEPVIGFVGVSRRAVVQAIRNTINNMVGGEPIVANPEAD